MPVNPYVLLAVGLAWLASLVGVGIWQNRAGATGERVAWQAREAKNLQSYNDELRKQELEARGKELATAERQAAIDATYQENLRVSNNERDRALADLAAGRIRLRNLAAALQARERGASEAAPGAGEHHGAEGAGLSDETSRYLVGEAARADAVVEQLTACQALVKSDRSVEASSPSRDQ